VPPTPSYLIYTGSINDQLTGRSFSKQMLVVQNIRGCD
jgi:hypothetical protein